MLKTVPRPLTVDDYRELPAGPPYYQLVEGDILMAPSPDLFHQDVLLNLAVILRNYLQQHPLGSVHLAPSDVQLSELNVYQPDLYFVSKGRRSILKKQGPVGAPNLVIEILSPKTAKLDKGMKRRVYARSGVEELWLVDPERKRVEVYRFAESTDEPVLRAGPRQRFSSPLFPGLQVSLTAVFRVDRP
jgi:Uma2 family endonuclease